MGKSNDDLVGASTGPGSAAEIGIELGVPVSQRGQPALQDHRPRRFILKEEAQQRHWAWYYDGSACRYGHIAAKRVANDQCSDCMRVKRGEEPIYGKSKAQEFQSNEHVAKVQAARSPATAAATGLLPSATPAGASELTKAQQKFLECFAATEPRSLETAAKEAGTSVAWVEAQRTGSARFEQACVQLGVPRYIPKAGEFVWDDEKRELWRRTYVNTGIRLSAHEAVGCTPDDFFREIETNTVFKEMIDRAEPFAAQAIHDALARSAVGGQQQSLAKWLEMQQRAAEKDNADYITLAVNGQRVPRWRSPEELLTMLKRLADDLIDKNPPAYTPAPAPTPVGTELPLPKSDADDSNTEEKLK